MKHILASFIVILCLSSCAGGFNILGHQVEVVNNRNADGTFKPANDAVNAAGEHPDSWAMLYHYPSGNLGVSAYSGQLGGAFPKLTRQ